MKKLFTAFAIVGLALCGGEAVAEIGTIDDVPAATLLLPYFEVDLDANNDGVPCNDAGERPEIDTLFSVNNASAAPALAHVTLWTDWTHTTIDFDIYLTGYDVQTVSLYDLFCNGNLPRTATSDDPDEVADTWSPSPPFIGPPAPGPGEAHDPGQADYWDNPTISGLDTSECIPKFPFDDGVLAGSLVQDLIINGHTGQEIPAEFAAPAGTPGQCIANDYGDLHARGYATIDSVSECSFFFPNINPGYFQSGGTGVANNNNILWGDYFLVEAEEDFAQGETLVHLEADEQFEARTPPVYTFYGRWVNVATLGFDAREPLGTTYATRYLADAPPFDGTDLLVWRDAKFADNADGQAACGTTPDWYPLNETSVVAFDEEERFVVLCEPEEGGGPVSPPPPGGADPTCFPAETQRVPVVGDNGIADPLNVPWDFGWIFLNLNHTLAEDNQFNEIAASWVSAVMRAEGIFSVGLNAIQLDNVDDYYPGYDSAATPFIADPDDGPAGGGVD